MKKETDSINYAAFVDNAMRGAVRDMLRHVEKQGMPEKNHFYISFRTDHPAAMISEALRSKYPTEITIVLQHQFWDLYVGEESFRVMLSFNNIPEKLVIPFAALTGFADPSTKFGLQFFVEVDEEDTQDNAEEMDASSMITARSSELPVADPETKILTLDAFRKKK